MSATMVLPAAASSAAYHPAPSRAAGAQVEEPAPAVPSPPMPNPQFRIDPALSLVVLEFRDNGGEIALSIPSPKELKAYRESPPPEPRAGIDVSR